MQDKPCHAVGSDGKESPRRGAGWLPKNLAALPLLLLPCPPRALLMPSRVTRRGSGAAPPAQPRREGHRDGDRPVLCAPALLSPILSEGSSSFPARLCFSPLISQTVATHKGEGTARTPSVWRARQTQKADLRQHEGFCASAKRGCFSLPAARGWLRSGGTNLSSHDRVPLPSPAHPGWGCLGRIK